MLKDKVIQSASSYFRTMEQFDRSKSFGDSTPWIFNFYKGEFIGATIIANPPNADNKESAFFHILNLLTFDKFDMVTINIDTYFTTQSKEKEFTTPPSQSVDRQEAIISIGATKNGLEQSMLVYGRDDNGVVYEKEIVNEGVGEGWMTTYLEKIMSMPLSIEQMIHVGREQTDIFDDDADKSNQELVEEIKQEWIDLLTEND